MSKQGKTFRRWQDYVTFTKSEEFKKSFSKNKNPNATREYGSRGTYVGRDYAGRAGKFAENEKILIRYNKNNELDFKFLEDLWNRLNENARLMTQYNREILEYGLDVTLKALIKYTPVDTGELLNSMVVTITNRGTILIHSDSDYVKAQNYGKNGERNGKAPYGWYPGYYFFEKSAHEATIKMKEKARELGMKLKNEVER